MASELRIRHARTLAPALSSLGGRFAYGQREKEGREKGRDGGLYKGNSNHPGDWRGSKVKYHKKHEKIINKKNKKWIK